MAVLLIRVLAATRRIWTAWGMSEERAYQTARQMFDPVYQITGGCDGCGRGPGERCGHAGPRPVSIDLLEGTV